MPPDLKITCLYCIMIPQFLKNRLNRLKDRLLAFPAVRMVVGTLEELGRDDASHLSAGVAYFAILSLFPLLLGFISLAGLFLPADRVQEMIIQFMQNNLPISPDITADTIDSIIASRSVIGVFSVLGLFWTSSNMFSSIGVALNRSCGACERRSFFLRKPRDILFALAAGFLFLLAGVLPTVFGLIPEVDVPFFGTASNTALLLIGSGLTWMVFVVLYTYLPTTRSAWNHHLARGTLSHRLVRVLKGRIYFFRQLLFTDRTALRHHQLSDCPDDLDLRFSLRTSDRQRLQRSTTPVARGYAPARR